MSSQNPALEQFIRSIPLFSFVEPADLTEVLRLLRPVELSAGDVVFREGDAGRAMWILGEGTEISVSSTGAQKKQVVVAYAKKGDVLGEMALVDDGPRSGTAVVTQGGHAHELDAQEFHHMRSTFVPAAFKVLRKICLDLCGRIRQTNERIVPSGTGDVQTPPLPRGPSPDPAELDEFPAFKGMPAVVKLALAQKLQRLTLEGVTPLFAEGEPADGAYFILDGEVSVGRNGKTLATLPAGTMFGMVACLDAGPRSASCLTTGPSRLLKITPRDFDALFASGHRFAYQVVDLVARQLVQHLRDANQLLPLPGKPSGPSKVAKPIESALVSADEAAAVIDAVFGVDPAMPPLEFELEVND